MSNDLGWRFRLLFPTEMRSNHPTPVAPQAVVRPWWRIARLLVSAAILCLFIAPLTAAEGKGADAASPVEVRIGLTVDQITAIDQREENFSVVASLRANYRDPELAYTAAQGDPPFRLFHLSDFLKYAQERKSHWPGIVFDNQQGRRDISTELVALAPDGDVRYLQRFTATFQAPHFDFRRFPFDEQEFHIHISSVLPTDFYVFKQMQDREILGNLLGEEEWVVTDATTQVSTATGESGSQSSRYTLSFNGHRHLTYYIARIYVPVFIILMVSWFTFLLRDYAKRVDIGITTLLLFIAFNFAVSSDLPRLGYMTLMDAFMTGTFVITSVVLLVNVIFRRLQTSGHEELANRLDRYTIWGYWPAYVAGMSITLLWL